MPMNELQPTELAESPFLPNTRTQFAWDSVSLTAAMACWRRYYYMIVLGLTPKGPARAIALDFGIAFHKGMEHYQHALAAGSSHADAVTYSVQTLLADEHFLNLPTHEENVAAEAAAEEDDDGIHARNAKVRTRYHLMRAVVWYLEQYADDPVQTLILDNGRPATELSFRMELPLTVNGRPIMLTGHLDRVGYFNDHLYVLDYKTTKAISRQFFADFAVSHQITGYTVAGQSVLHQPVRGAIIDGIALQVGGVKLARQTIDRSEGQINEYLETVQHTVNQAAQCDENDRWPMNTSACYFCHFKELCARPPEYRQNYINMLYDQRPAWNPLESR